MATVTITPGPIAKLAFVPPTAGSLTTGMSEMMTIQTQDKFGNSSPAITAITIIVRGDEQSRFTETPSGVWTASGTFTRTGTSNLTFFFKQNGTITTVIVTADGANTSTTCLVTILSLGSNSSGSVIADDGKTKVEIGTSAVTGAGCIEIDTSGTSTETIVREGNANDDADPKINRVDGTLRKFDIWNATILVTVRIFIPYPDIDNDGFVDGAIPAMRVSSLAIYHLVWTGTTATWQKVNSRIDSINKVVYADVYGFSYYTLMGAGFEPTLEKALVYPNPYYADKHAGMGITFAKLTENSTIQIFTITGELVREISTESTQQKWDVLNESGEKVAPGIYIYLIKDPAGNKKIGKLGVIR